MNQSRLAIAGNIRIAGIISVQPPVTAISVDARINFNPRFGATSIEI
jgi:hypothetical protein